MQKMNCNIIQDLMPSYMDDICSKESRELIDEHFTECEDCKKLYEKSMLELLHENSITTKDIDYLKKIKDAVFRKNISILVIIGIVYLMELWINFSSYANVFNYFIFTPVTCGLLFFVLPDFTENEVPKKRKYMALGIELAAIMGSFLFLLTSGWVVTHYRIPFDMRVDQIGPFISGILYIVLFGFIFIFPLTLYYSLKKKAVCPALCFIPVGAISLLFEYQHYLHEFSNNFAVVDFAFPTVFFSIETLGMLGLYMLVNRKK